MRTPLFCALVVATTLPLPVTAQSFEWGRRNTDFPPAFPEQFRAPLIETAPALAAEPLATGLEHPWGIATLPSGGWLVTERPGRLRHLAPDGTLSAPIAGVPEVVAARQGGLLDVALAPDFADSRVIYVTYAKPIGNQSATAAARMVLANDMTSVSAVTDIFVQDPPSPTPMHFGSRIVFLPDGTVAITTGEHSSRSERVFAQDLDKTYGKVIRVTDQGAVPEDNPFLGDAEAVDTIWSYGHRNIQGATVGPDGTLWTIEHGPRGGDELNRPEAGLNYGWPVISYGENYNGTAISQRAAAPGMEQPVYFWDPVIAPGGMAFHSGETFGDWNGDLLIGSLNPGGVVRLSLRDGLVVEEERMLMDLGRIRDVEVQPDGSFLVLTDFSDGGVWRISPDE
ncbi:glucose dehydrogenase [Jannaschia pagri]|uniref:Glucose dehydrogenase n=1 Tax=Jannaschia pagri TaxID=2829797 RepID=A0ABQ4NR61_9RHOB|nr:MULTISPECIES: PQQ-dependent sugar dehydrogenase [unclassified Jannaschia]GIT93071.1 glucose dehydrogenase [Jannaschia sp. AI_61]GIT96906.1 glucose dehydrogenase [Jannaschia sp. AI_62]